MPTQLDLSFGHMAPWVTSKAFGTPGMNFGCTVKRRQGPESTLPGVMHALPQWLVLQIVPVVLHEAVAEVSRIGNL